MSDNRRKSPFRYVLKEPVAFELQILDINGTPAPPKPVPAQLHDLSRSGCCVSIPLEIPVESNQVRIGMDMVLTEDPLYMEGIMRWDREENGRFFYGVELDIPESEHDTLPRELRMLAGARRIIVF